MNIFQKQSIHKKGGSILLTLLLSVAVFLSSLCVAAWNAINDQFSSLEQGYTTFAVHAGNNMEKLVYSNIEEHLGENGIEILDWSEGKEFFGQDSCAFPDGSLYAGPIDAASAAATSAHVLDVDQRLLLSAHVEGMTPLSTGRLDHLEYIQGMDKYCYNSSVAALECVDILQSADSSRLLGRTVTFRVVDWISRSDAYDLPPYGDLIKIHTNLVDDKGKEIFQVGKTYLVRGFYQDYPIIRGAYDVTRQTRDVIPEYKNIYRQMDTDMLMFSGDGKQHFDFAPVYDSKNSVVFLGYTTHDEMWPVVSEYTGSWEEFLETEAGRVWKEEIIPFTRINQNSAPVILTDNLESVPGFVVGDARLLEGRTFSATEYTQGRRVCVVSSQYATLNGLKIGDSINLDFYDTGAETALYNYSIDLSGTYALRRYPMASSNHMGIKEDYTIVGIYTSPGLKGSLHDFGNDTIFVPKNSVPGWEQCSVLSHPSMHSVVIQNGSIEAFESDMAAAGLPETYRYYDQGYSELENYLQTLLRHAQTMLIIGLPIFVLVVLVFLLLEGKRRSLVIRAMRLLGIKRGIIWKQSISAILSMALVAIVLGNVLSVLFFRVIMAGIMSAEMNLDFGGVVLFTVLQLLFVFVLTALWMFGAVNRNLLKRK